MRCNNTLGFGDELEETMLSDLYNQTAIWNTSRMGQVDTLETSSGELCTKHVLAVAIPQRFQVPRCPGAKLDF